MTYEIDDKTKMTYDKDDDSYLVPFIFYRSLVYFFGGPSAEMKTKVKGFEGHSAERKNKLKGFEGPQN